MVEEKKELNEMSPEEMDRVSGGVYYNSVWGDAPHEILDEKGNLVGKFTKKEDAMDFAKSKNISTDQISWGELERMKNSQSGFPHKERPHDLPGVPEKDPNWNVYPRRYPRGPYFPDEPGFGGRGGWRNDID